MATLDELSQQIRAGGVPSAALMDQYRTALEAQTAANKAPNPLLPQPLSNPGGFLTPAPGSAGDTALRGGQTVGGLTYNPAGNSVSYGQQPSVQTAPPQQPNPLIAPAGDPGLLARAQSVGNQISGGGVPSADLMGQYRAALDNLVYGTRPTGVRAGIGEGLAAIYQNELGRAPDQEGIDYWTRQYTSGAQTLDQIERNIALGGEATGRDSGAGNLYYDRPIFSGDEYTPYALAGRGLAQQGQQLLPVANPIAPPASPTIAPPASAPIGHNNPPPGPLPTMPRTPDTAPLTTRPATAFASDYNYTSPVDRQLAAANNQRATPMTQPVGFASNNPLLNRFGTARLGEYTGARETPGNVPGPYTPVSNPLPGIFGAAPASQGGSGQSSTGGGLSTEQAIALAAAAPALAGLVGKGGEALINGLSAFPAGASLLGKMNITAADVAGMELSPAGKLVPIAGTAAGTSRSAAFAQNFNAALKPGWLNVASAGLAALPDILNGDYTKAAGAGAGAYVGAAAGTAVGAGIGGIAGNFIIPGLGGIVGTFLGRKVGGLFGPGASVGPNGGQSMEIDRNTGALVPGLSGQDNSGQAQEGFSKQFMEGVATVVNEANQKAGMKFLPNYSPNLPVAVEVIGGKINVVDHEGNKQQFAGNDIENAFKYAVGVATAYPGLKPV